ncbi:HD domain-containing protein [Hufsiella ginkgonis]|uniref:Phosphohydrolase n=1 Tax=Hufsiella ginkgonis TaxID=2695274 RepID=A0A7K1XWX5_9SPHI|nr:phosphohydrolase [Hufsiella ginkgonis]MXV15480.1 phosphohydrolase [Hufsiella ginkgonis]
MQFEQARDFIAEKLNKELPPYLTYHTLAHTLDVLRAAETLATAEGVTGYEKTLLQTAAMFHDSGYLSKAAGHEDESCRLAMSYLPGFGYTEKEITAICGMIRATKLPQSPKNHLEEILCDADLDYLGRGDYFIVAERFFQELSAAALVNSEAEWNTRQVSFLETHRYFTDTAIQLRKATKIKHLQSIKLKMQQP